MVRDYFKCPVEEFKYFEIGDMPKQKITKKMSKKISRHKRKYERTHITFKEEPKIMY